jgi:flavin reductase (DIM6/NTAB) family NADH-FMN oxidoreductase RutF
VNVLHAGQGDLAARFAGRPASEPPNWDRPDPELAPRLSGCLASIACRPWTTHEAGDHVLFLGEVARIEHFGAEPLIFYRGAFRELGQELTSIPWLESADSPGISWFSLSS